MSRTQNKFNHYYFRALRYASDKHTVILHFSETGEALVLQCILILGEQSMTVCPLLSFIQ